MRTNAETHKQLLHWTWGILMKSGQKHLKKTQNLLTRAHRAHRNWTGNRRALHVYYSCITWSSCGTSNGRSRGCCWFLCWYFGSCTSYWVALPSLKTRCLLLLELHMTYFIYIPWRLALNKGEVNGGGVGGGTKT